MNAIFKRRSIRKYTDESISDEDIKLILKAAMAAPSAMNLQPWELIVVKERETLNKITEFHPYSQMLKEANLAIIVCGNEERQSIEGYWVQDCSAAIENILLEAEELGLGAVWLGVYPGEERMNQVSELFNLPSHVKPLSIISIGHPDEVKPESHRYDENKVHYETWK